MYRVRSCKPITRRRSPDGSVRAAQRGVTLILILVMIALAAGTLAVTLLSGFGSKLRGDQVTEQVLAKAKEALIAYAATDANRPGELLCPDTNNNGQIDIGVDTIGSNCAALVGRLPWRSLGIADLRDGSGERLWYALSDDFHANGSVALNSDTPGQLTVTGITPATSLVAVVFAPGAAIASQGQSRTSANANAAAHYLEGTNATSTTTFVTANASATFNDRLITIRPAEIFRLAEKRVAAELRSAGTYLAKYVADWGRYPFAAAFGDTSVPANFAGTAGTYEGLFPAAAAVNPVALDSGASSMAGGLIFLGCSSTTNQMTCTSIWLSFAALPIGNTVTITAYANNVGSAFVDPITAASVAANPPLNNVTIVSQALEASGRARIVITGQTSAPIAFFGMQSVTITRPQLSAWVGSSWITQNQWPRVAYYAVAPGWAPGGAGSCTTATNACGSPPTPPGPNSCLSICNTSTGTANNDVRALVVMTGPVLAGQTRGPYTVGSYLEGGNLSVFDRIYESKPIATTFNDQPFALAP